MSLWFAALLGLVQGITEFLPISSTAHLRITPALFGQPDAGGLPCTLVANLSFSASWQSTQPAVSFSFECG